MSHTPQTEVGYEGKVNIGASDVSEVTKWTYKESSKNQKYVSAQSQGNERTRQGPRSCSGTVECKYDEADPLEVRIKRGDSVTLKLYTKTGRYYQIPAVVGEVSLDVDGENIKSASFSWDSDGVWTYPDGSTSARS